MESFCEEVSEKDEDDDWLDDSEEIEAINKLLRKDEELKKLTAITLHKPQVSQLSSELADPPDLGQLAIINPASVSPSIHNALVLNKACVELLIQLEKKLEGQLQENLRKQKELETFINSNRRDYYLPTKVSIKCLGMPYFKDLDGFPPPQNSVTLKKIANNELLPEDLAINLRMWSVTDHNDLKKAVIEHVKDLKFKELSKKENELKRSGRININDYQAVIAEMEAVKNASDKSLNIDPKKIDWMKISAQDMKGVFSDTECESKWVLELDPKLNKSKWKNDEFESLVKIVKEFNFQNWEEIAEKLGTNRSGFQCCVKFYSKKNFGEGKWTDEEVEKLIELREKYRIKDYIPLCKIAWYLDTRSLKQITHKFENCITPNKRKGRFDKSEDSMIVIGAKEFSNNFQKISECIPERNPKQIRARFEYLIGKYMTPFSKEEEEKLIKLVGQYSKNWKLISEHFENRSSLQCRKHWGILQKSIQEDESYDDDDLSGSESLDYNSSMIEISNTDVSLVKVKKHTGKVKEDLADKSAAYVLLLKYLHTGHEFFFGPRSRNIEDFDLMTSLVYKTQIAMETLKVPLNALTNSDNRIDLPETLEDINLGSSKLLLAEEECVLYHLQMNEVFRENQDKFVNNVLIPPNYTTLVGLRSLMLGRAAIRNFADATLPESNKDYKIRKTFEEAKELWKSRLKILFTLPIVCSQVDFKPVKYKKSKIIKPKPMSHLKRKAHSKHLTEAKKMKRNLLSEDGIVFMEKEEKNPKPKKPKVVTISEKPRGRPRKNTEKVTVQENAEDADTESAGVRRTKRQIKIPSRLTHEE